MAKATSPASVDPRLPALVNAERLITQRLAEMFAYEPCLADPDKVYELHEMRIAAKRLRYTMEVFQDVYTLYAEGGAEFAVALEAVKGLQEHLGALHDADVLVPQLLEHLNRLIQPGYGLPDANDPSASSSRRASSSEAPGKKKTKSARPLPIAGVHRVDYAACEGLLTLCAQLRADRDTRYAQLIQEWQRLLEAHVFTRLRDVIAEAGQSREERKKEEGKRKREKGKGESKSNRHPERLNAGRPLADKRPTPNTQLSEDSDAATRQIPQIQRAPGEPGHVAAARRRVASRPQPKTQDRRGEARGGEESRGEGEKRRRGDARKQPADDTRPPRNPKPKVQNPKSPAVLHARNGSARAARHPRPGTDSGPGAGEGGDG